nr:protein Simiate [Ipomoea batatas]GMD36035.1 protein Simiate [Ipomoea batatas]
MHSILSPIQHSVKCCVKGSLLEVNERLVERPELLISSAEREGYIAIIMPKPADWLKIKASLLGKEDYCYICNDNQMKEYVSKLEKELASTRAQLQAQNDMQKAMGGALVAVLEKTFGKVPEQFVTLLTKHLNQ